MDIKVLCQCGAKFQFEIEPVHGRMPCVIQCPSCGADATEAANGVIAQNMPAPAPVAAPVAVATAVAAPVESAIPYCAKHAGEVAAAECFVCQKPICSRCMEQFGFLCSSYCKGQAQARKLKVPVYSGQIHEKAGAERRSQNFILVGSIAMAALLFGAYVYYWFVLSHPKTAFKIETGGGTPFLHAEWVGDDRFFGVTPTRVTMYNAGDGSEIWGAELPSGEIKTTKGFEEGSYDVSFEPVVKVVSKDIWVGLPSRVMRLDGLSGKKKQEVMLPARADGYQVGESHFLAVSSNSTNDSKLLTRINLANGQLESQMTPATTGARRVVGTVTQMQGLRNTSLSRLDSKDEDFADFNTTSFDLDRDYLFTGANVAHLTRRLMEERIEMRASTKPRSGPSIIDSPNARAGQGMEAAEEFLNQNQPDTKIDQSLYAVTIRRFFGGAPEWNGQVTGRPFFYSLKTVDYLVAGNTLIVFNKNNAKLWEAKLTYGISPDFWNDEDGNGPAMELGNRLLFYDQGVLTAFDLKKGEAQWRVNSVGISGLAPDGEGNLYVSSTTAGPEAIQYAKQINLGDRVYPMVVKVELKSGKVLWQSARVGTKAIVSNGIIYTSNAQISGMEMISSASRGEDVPVNWRLYRLDPGNGKDIWEHHRIGIPRAILPKEKRVILQYRDHLRLLKYM